MRPARARIFVLVAAAALWAAAGRAADLPKEMELWPEGVPGLKPNAGPEVARNGTYSNIHHPRLLVFPPPAGTANGTSVIYCPGGGYVHVAVGGLNGGAMTQWFNSLGVTVFVLLYRNQEYGHPAPLQDVLRAVRLVRSNAAAFGLDPNRIGVFGGSAGAHLAACAGTLYNDPEGKTGAALDAVSARPDFLMLIFPVITMEPPYAHAASRAALLGPNPTPELVAKLSVEKQVTQDTPPAFLVHTMEDHTVSEENTLLFYEALLHAGVPVEMHLYEKGPHGSGLGANNGPTNQWPRRAEEWMRFHGWLPAVAAAPAAAVAPATPAAKPAGP